MSETSQGPGEQRRLGGWKSIVAIVLVIVYAAAATYGVMSDTSARGLTVKMYSISRSCPVSSSNSQKTLTYSIGGSIWSSSSLTVSLTHLSFTLSVDGSVIGTAAGSDSSFGPGQSTSFALSFTDPTLNPSLNPTILPKTSQIVLDLTARVVSGLYSSTITSSDNTLQSFGSTGC